MTCPIAILDEAGDASMHQITSPVVEGTGEALPGLLGLKTLEEKRAILDMGTRKLHLPGHGDVQFELPPGSLTIPLEKAPSGHLCMPVDGYDKVPAQTGGLRAEDSALTLVSGSSSQEAAAAVEQRRELAQGDRVIASTESESLARPATHIS